MMSTLLLVIAELLLVRRRKAMEGEVATGLRCLQLLSVGVGEAIRRWCLDQGLDVTDLVLGLKGQRWAQEVLPQSNLCGDC